MNQKEILEGLKKYITDNLILKKDWKKEFDALMKDEKIKSRVAFLPVRPDWNEPRKLWGYYNPLTGLFYPTDALNVLLNAFRDFVIHKDANKKHFIILDEMNLARVEYYMSDLLSLMENMCSAQEDGIAIGETAMLHPLNRCLLSKLPDKNEWDKYIQKEGEEIRWKQNGEKLCMESCENCCFQSLKDNKKEQKGSNNNNEEFIKAFNPIPPRIAYPENLVIIGTVNVDETTFSFAPKVLDRAFVLEFNEVYIKENDETGYFDIYKEDFEGIKGKLEEFQNFIEKLQDILKPATLHFGYRVIKEMGDYLKNSQVDDNAFDFLLKSKVLPKIHGTEEMVGSILKKLFLFSKEDIDPNIRVEEVDKKLQDWSGEKETWSEKEPTDFRYIESARKIQEMYKRMKAVGYASYF